MCAILLLWLVEEVLTVVVAFHAHVDFMSHSYCTTARKYYVFLVSLGLLSCVTRICMLIPISRIQIHIRLSTNKYILAIIGGIAQT